MKIKVVKPDAPKGCWEHNLKDAWYAVSDTVVIDLDEFADEILYKVHSGQLEIIMNYLGKFIKSKLEGK